MSLCAKRWGMVRVCVGVEGEVEDSAENKREEKNNWGREDKEVPKSMTDVGNYSYLTFAGP